MFINEKDLDPSFDDFSSPVTLLSMPAQPKRQIDMIIEARVMASASSPPYERTSASYTSVHGEPMSCESLISFALLVQ